MTPTTPIKALLFDKDGTLLDFAATWSPWAARFLAHLSKGDQALATHLGRAIGYDVVRGEFVPNSPVIAGTPGQLVDLIQDFLPQWRREALLDCANDTARDTPLAAATDLAVLFARLAPFGLKYGVATNDSEQAARQHSRDLGICAYMDYIIGFDSGYMPKPAPDMLLAFSENTGVPARHVAMIGDSLHDLQAAEAAGMLRVGVLTGPATRADLAPAADLVLESIAQLPEWLASVEAQP